MKPGQAPRFWTEEEEERLRIWLLDNPHTERRDAQQLFPDRSTPSVESKIRGIMPRVRLSPQQRARTDIQRAAEEAAEESPAALREQICRLNARIAQLQAQTEFLAHSDAPEFTGGTISILAGDEHIGDLGHLLVCHEALQVKEQELLRRYKPRRVQLLQAGDTVVGRDIFKGQTLCNVSDDVNEQIQVAVMTMRRRIFAIQEATPDTETIEVFVVSGNHDRQGGVSIAPYYHAQLKLMVEDRGGTTVKVCYCGDRALVNLADSGEYLALMEHGFGYSQISPSSQIYINTMKDKLIALLKQGINVRRVLHGHTHFLAVGIERANDVIFDTCGGLQRNERVNLGQNQRPVGWVVYISPPGSSDIVEPIALKPDPDTLWTEMDAIDLHHANREHFARLLKEYRELAEAKGFLGPRVPGYPEGRP